MLRFYYIEGKPLYEFDYQRYASDPKILSDELLILASGRKFNDKGLETQYDIEEAFDEYRNLLGINLPTAFEELRKLSPVTSMSFVAFVGKRSNKFENKFGYVHKHFHPPATDINLKYISGNRRTTTVVVPTKLANEVNEILCMQQIDYDFMANDYVAFAYETESWIDQLPKTSDVIKIRMPSEGEYLVLDFESSHMVHWIENSLDSANEFICLVNDI